MTIFVDWDILNTTTTPTKKRPYKIWRRLRDPELRSANPQGKGGYSDVIIHTSDPVFIGSEYIHWLGSFFFFFFFGGGGVQNFKFQYFGGLQKMNIFWGMMILWIFLGGHHKIGLY